MSEDRSDSGSKWAWAAQLGRWCWHRRALGTQVFIRGAAWSLGIFIALLPAVSASNAPFGTLRSMANAAIAAGHYRDFYFIVVVASVLGLTTTLVHIFKYNDGLAEWARAVFGGLSFFFIAIAVIGVDRFKELAKIKTDQQIVLGLDLDLMFWTLLAGLVAEIAVVLREHAP